MFFSHPSHTGCLTGHILKPLEFFKLSSFWHLTSESVLGFSAAKVLWPAQQYCAWTYPASIVKTETAAATLLTCCFHYTCVDMVQTVTTKEARNKLHLNWRQDWSACNWSIVEGFSGVSAFMLAICYSHYPQRKEQKKMAKSKSSNEMMCSNTDKEERAFMKMSKIITVSSSCDLEKTEKTFWYHLIKPNGCSTPSR